VRTTVRPALPVHLGQTLAPLAHGRGDPQLRFAADGVWRATRTPDGPATVHLRTLPGGEVEVTTWGPGAEWAVAQAPDLLGGRDSLAGWEPRHPLIRDLHRRHPGLRIGRTGLVLEALVPAVLEQKVTGEEARRSWRLLLYRFGTPAPGPGAERGLRVLPAAPELAALPSWEWHRLGVEEKRARVIRAAAGVAPRLEEAVSLPADAALARLQVVPGIGPWTAAEVAQRAFGDPDAVSVGDYHLPHFVGWALAGHRVDDDGMLELLAPYRPHRHRAVRLLEASGLRAPRFGPRFAGRDIRAL
jgi:3-methyladenine DNA glycosylase/8-oxoguanine DNA glycosylase